jgi:uncharacterized protein (TIGR00369 family)
MTTPNTEASLLERGRAALAAQPFSLLLGAHLERLVPGSAELRVPLRLDLLQQHGFVHGAVVGYAADNALTFAAGSVLGPAVVTAGYCIEFLRPATGSELVAQATVLHAGKARAVCRCDVFSSDASGALKLCAVAQGTVAALGL